MPVSGLPAGFYSIYVSGYAGELPIEFDFDNPQMTPRATIQIYPGTLDLQKGLGSPKQNEMVGGFGVIRGWACYKDNLVRVRASIGKLSYQIDDGPLNPVPYGSSRGDVTERCDGLSNTGFGAPINWNRFSLGKHTFKLFVDGEEVINRNIIVSGTGETFLRGFDAEYVLDDFPNVGEKTTVRWTQSAQNFTIIGVESE